MHEVPMHYIVKCIYTIIHTVVARNLFYNINLQNTINTYFDLYSSSYPRTNSQWCILIMYLLIKNKVHFFKPFFFFF